jgi:hypothetical protein
VPALISLGQPKIFKEGGRIANRLILMIKIFSSTKELNKIKVFLIVELRQGSSVHDDYYFFFSISIDSILLHVKLKSP